MFAHCYFAQAILWLSMLVVASATVNLQISAGRVDGAIICIALWLITFPLALLVEVRAPPLAVPHPFRIVLPRRGGRSGAALPLARFS